MTAVSLSVEEFLASDFPTGTELFEGSVWVTDPSILHQEICARLLEALREWSRSPDGSGRAVFGGNWRVNDNTLLKPDVWWVDASTWSTLQSETVHDGLPQLVVEVRSPGTWPRDIGSKRMTYMSNGVLELWLVDVASSSVIVVRPDGSPLGGADEITTGVLTSPLLPGFAVSLPDLFAD